MAALQVMAALERAVCAHVFHFEAVGLVNVMWAWATLQHHPSTTVAPGWADNSKFMRGNKLVFSFEPVRHTRRIAIGLWAARNAACSSDSQRTFV